MHAYRSELLHWRWGNRRSIFTSQEVFYFAKYCLFHKQSLDTSYSRCANDAILVSISNRVALPNPFNTMT